MEKIMELIKEKGIDKNIQDAVNKAGALSGGNVLQNQIDSNVKKIICLELIRDSDLSEAIFDAMFDKVVDEIVARLNITYQPDVYEGKEDELKDNLRTQTDICHAIVTIIKHLS